MAYIFGWNFLVINVIAFMACDRVCGQPKDHHIAFYDFEKIFGQTVHNKANNSGFMATMKSAINITNGKCGHGIVLNKQPLEIETPSSNETAVSEMQVTIAAWVFLYEEGKTGKRRTIFTSFHDLGASFLYFGIHSDGFLRFSATNRSAEKNNFKTSSQKLAPGVWHHVAVSYTFNNSNENCIFYINAMNYSSKSSSKSSSKNSKDGMVHMVYPIGYRPLIGSSNKDEPLNGTLDDFYVFNKALNAQEIKKLKEKSCKGDSAASTPGPRSPPIYHTPAATVKTTKMVSSSTYQPTSLSTVVPMVSSSTYQPTSLSTTVVPMSPGEKLRQEAENITTTTEGKNFLTIYVHERIAGGDTSTEDGVTNGAIKRTEEFEDMALIVAKNTLKLNQSLSLKTTSAFILLNRPVSGFTFPSASQQNSNKVLETISFPDEMVKTENEKPRTFVCIAYSDLHKNMPKEFIASSGSFKPNTTLELHSNIIGSAVDPPLDKSLTDPITISFNHDELPAGVQVCSFWNHTISTAEGTSGGWSTEGCKLDEKHSTSTKTVCLCNHLTNFALLLQREGAAYSDPPLSLKIITIIGCTLSVLACLLCIIMFFTLKKKDIRHYLHINLTIAIAIAQLILLFGITQTEHKILCKAMAALLHYFYMVAFLFMLCEGIHLAILIETAFSHGDLKLPVYLIASWGLPLIIVGITLGARYDNYGGDIACFISANQGTVYAFVGPFAVVLLINFVILFIVLRQVINKTSLPISSKTASKFEIARATIRSLVILFPVMGFTWMFGILFFGFRTLALEYLFAIFCSLQGFFIFLFQYALNSENRMAFVRATRRWRLTMTSSTNTSANGTKQTRASKAIPTSPREEEMNTTSQDNCHLVSYRAADDKTIQTASTFI